ncbi:MAG TPA: UDP-N-acetylglucosamine 2-epimerase (non-hydrolyzing) [Gemmatimonadales bacterium]|nr:UDP-N-acetylglucosamine 2-epimerase (non-hydrolyzing) [Gemmatimonadales bacterium]
MRTIVSVVGARPNFMKLAPLAHVLAGRADVKHLIVHTGQHYDEGMSESFIRTLRIPRPDFNLGAGSASHAQQTATIMQRFEPVCLETKPDLVLVYGDVNSTVAAALVASKLGIKVGHVEAGLRSRDWSMPEEINRVVTDRLSDLLFTPSRDAGDNLRAEGVPAERVHFVGNIMIDSLLSLLPEARNGNGNGNGNGKHAPYAVVTLHRPSNVDDPAALMELLRALTEVSRERRILFPVHPRTRARIADLAWQPPSERITLLEPLPYIEMLRLVLHSDVVITDSGGLQEETSYLGIPCLTVRENTERPITCTEGTNRLVAARSETIGAAVRAVVGTRRRQPPTIELWDGRTAQRIAEVVAP